MAGKRKRPQTGHIYEIDCLDGLRVFCLASYAVKDGLIGYFFLDRDVVVDGKLQHALLQPGKAVYIANVSPMGIKLGEWIDLGKLSGFREEEWPFPTFRAFFDPDYPHLCFKVIYDKADLVGDVRIRCTPDELEGLPEDGIVGDRVVRNKLRIIAGLAPLASSLPPYKPPNKR
jgi:hypothetical protein